MQSILDYIKTNWKNTIREPSDGAIFPFTSPSIESMYQDFYYWDTFFTNKGLIMDGYIEQVENNLDNIANFISTLGYMPNSNHLLNRSQPPLFSKMVRDYYEIKHDIQVINKYLPIILKEYNFWMSRRYNEKYNLNEFKCDDSVTDEDLDIHYEGLKDRVKEYSDDLFRQREIAKDIIAIAESGLDFNARFKTSKSKIDISKFLQLDINCLMYDMENNISYFFKEIEDDDSSLLYKTKAESRKQLINKYFLREDGIYLDYNYVDNCYSSLVTAVSLYPYAFGISDDAIAARKVLELLELPHGVTACQYRGKNEIYYQWDYPTMFAEIVYFIYIALKNVNLDNDAKRIKNKYLETVEYNFNKFHKLFEKYDALTGEISNAEYDAPDMMGWTAFAYKYFSEED